MNAAPTEFAFCLSQPSTPTPQAGTLGGVERAVPEIGLFSIRSR